MMRLHFVFWEEEISVPGMRSRSIGMEWRIPDIEGPLWAILNNKKQVKFPPQVAGVSGWPEVRDAGAGCERVVGREQLGESDEIGKGSEDNHH